MEASVCRKGGNGKAMSHEVIVRFPPHDGENEIFDYFKTTSQTCEIKYAIHLLMHIYYKEYILRSYH